MKHLFRPDESWQSEAGLGDDCFADDIAPFHWRLDADQYENVYVVGDVHGCLDELEHLWDRLGVTDDDAVVFVGDLVRKGPDTAGVVEFVRSRENAVSVRGNNEAKLLDGRIDTAPFEDLLDHVAAFPLTVSFDDVLVVHGGIDHRRRLADHGRWDLLEMRAIPPENGYSGPFWFERYQGPPRVFFGHTVLDSPYVSESAVGLDTGCVYGGSLTAYDYRNDELLTVDATETYRERSDDSILDLQP